MAIDITTNANNALAPFLLAGIVNNLRRALYSLVKGRRSRLFAGAGGNWPTINEVPVKSVFPQSNGNACGQTLLKERGISVTQVQVGEFSPRPRMDTHSLAEALTTLDTIRWRGAGVDANSLNALNARSPWIVMLRDRDNHWVIVDGFDGAGNIAIRDPWGVGTSYSMTIDDFNTFWTGYAVYRQ